LKKYVNEQGKEKWAKVAADVGEGMTPKQCVMKCKLMKEQQQK